MSSARKDWLDAHPYLRPMSELQGVIQDAAARDAPPAACLPRWQSYAADHALGVPLLASASAGLDCAAAADVLERVAERVAVAALPGKLGLACRALREELRADPALASEAISWVVGAAPPPVGDLGVLRLVGWAVLRAVLAPVTRYSARWHDEAHWGRGYCPTCGALPPCAHLRTAGAWRTRFLACGCCGTRWSYRRLGCPFCGTDEPERLSVLEIEGEEGLRIDACDVCKGYLKTYAGDGGEDLFLADWPTLHLDVLALGRGLRRAGTSLYDVPDEPRWDERRSRP